MFFPKTHVFPKCIFPKCIFAKCTRLACLLSFASLFYSWSDYFHSTFSQAATLSLKHSEDKPFKEATSLVSRYSRLQNGDALIFTDFVRYPEIGALNIQDDDYMKCAEG